MAANQILQRALKAIDRSECCVTVEIFTDNRPAVLVNGVNVGDLMNPHALKKWVRNTLVQNAKGRAESTNEYKTKDAGTGTE